MYGKIKHGERQTGCEYGERGAYRTRYDKQPVPPPKPGDSRNRAFSYIEARTGEYDEFEHDFMGDAYADGWAWHEAGKSAAAFKLKTNGQSKAHQAEARRLFKLGYNDSRKAKNETA